MYTKKYFFIIEPLTANNKEFIESFIRSAERNTNLHIEFNEHIDSVEAARSLADFIESESDPADSVLIQFVLSSNHPEYKQMKKCNLVYRSTQSILSKMPKVRFEKTDDPKTEKILVSHRREKMREVKPNLVFSRLCVGYNY